MGHGTTGVDAPAQQQSTMRCQRSVTVTHEDLRVGELAWTPAHLLRGSSALVDPYRVTNVYERNT
jgi:hypothetical protein